MYNVHLCQDSKFVLPYMVNLTSSHTKSQEYAQTKISNILFYLIISVWFSDFSFPDSVKTFEFQTCQFNYYYIL